MLEARTDSRALVVFYDEQADSYFICGVNMDVTDMEAVKADSEYVFVVNNRLFLSRNKVNLVKVNNLPADDGLLTLSAVKSARYVKELTVRENVKSVKRRKQYFEKLIDYYTNGQSRDGFMEEVAFAFTFSGSPVSILVGATNKAPLDSEERIAKVNEWYKRRRPQVVFGDETSYSLVFQSLLELNTLSLLSALAIDSGVAKKIMLPCLLAEFSEVDLQNEEGMSNSNLLRRMLERLSSNTIVSYLCKAADLSASEVFRAVSNVESSMEEYFGVFNMIAETICDHFFDGESLHLNRLTTTDYFAIESLTALISSLPDNIAANMRWGWRGVSTGELARSHIFAEIYAFLKKSWFSNNIIVIDEADLYLHPEWQRTFLYDLLHHLDNMRMYENISRPQVIICTHSPIIVSDFLPESIVSLRKDEYGQTVLAESFGFGNAIGDIYMSGMHLQSTFGEHAKKILDRIIVDARQGNLSDEDYRLVQKIPNNHVKNFLLSHD
ncbi:hypothetical protein BK673_06675 [Pseudomonas fluorescens]|uniref:Endonuclease GajA/Old nuclease/RecF-like AAA domain-containing protein n=2 Tax=Pseudomonas fluorescens TaxID=294 RepID=A0A423P9Y2_PSEFL|nr:hypothetical protein BK673_06675 [Pseudomonas fluorescens]